MIFGIGTDILQQSRVAKTWNRFGAHFANRVLLDDELELFSGTKNPVRFLAMRFAAKEAVSKALGTGFRKGVFWRNISVVNLPGGRPSVVLSGGALECLNRLIPKGFKPEIDISLTDDSGLAYAIVIISANPS